MEEDFDALRARLRAVLPGRIAAVIAGYDRFTAAPPPEDAKGFAAWHSAAKAALTHMEVLARLGRWAEAVPEPECADGEEADGRASGLDRLLAEARAALDGLGDDGSDDE